MSEWAEVAVLVGLLGLLIVTPWRSRSQGPKPKPGGDVCPMCKRALLTAHHHGVTVLPRPMGPRPVPAKCPPRPIETGDDDAPAT